MGDSEMTSDLIDEGKELIRRGIWTFIIIYIPYIYVYACLTLSLLEKKNQSCVIYREKEAPKDRRWREPTKSECKNINKRAIYVVGISLIEKIGINVKEQRLKQDCEEKEVWTCC